MQLMKIYQGCEATFFTQFSKLTIHNGMSYWTGHIAIRTGDIYTETKSVLNRYEVFLPMFAQRRTEVLHAMAFIRDIGEYENFLRAWNEWFCDEGITPPALTCVQADLAPQYKVEISFIVGYNKEKNPCDIKYMLNAAGTCSECVIHNGFARFSAVYAESDITGANAQLAEILASYEAMFARYGLSRKNVVCANIYMRDIDVLGEIQPTWCAWIGEDKPAVITQEAPPPYGKEIAVSLILASEPEAKIERLEVLEDRSRCVKYNGVAYLSGVTAEKTSGTANEEGKEVFEIIDGILERSGIDKKNVYFNQMFGENFPDFNTFDVGAFKDWSVSSNIYPSAFGFASKPPSGKAIEVAVIAAYE